MSDALEIDWWQRRPDYGSAKPSISFNVAEGAERFKNREAQNGQLQLPQCNF